MPATAIPSRIASPMRSVTSPQVEELFVSTADFRKSCMSGLEIQRGVPGGTGGAGSETQGVESDAVLGHRGRCQLEYLDRSPQHRGQLTPVLHLDDGLVLHDGKSHAWQKGAIRHWQHPQVRVHREADRITIHDAEPCRAVVRNLDERQ